MLKDVTLAAGATLKTFSNVERVMSDVWEEVEYVAYWDGAKVVTAAVGGVLPYEPAPEGTSVESRTTVTVDATPDVIALAAEYEARVAAERAKIEAERLARKRAEEKAREDATPYRGKIVRVARGRKVPIGLVGEVIWYGDGNFGRRVGIGRGAKGRDGKYTDVSWTAASNVDVVLGADGEPVATIAAAEALLAAPAPEPVVEEPVAPVVAPEPVVEAPAPVAELDPLARIAALEAAVAALTAEVAALKAPKKRTRKAAAAA